MSTEKRKEEPCVDLEKLESRIEDELDKIRKEVDDLYETVYKGNGHPSLVTRVNSVEGKLRGLREQMDEKISHLSRENSLKFDSIQQKLDSKFGRLEGWIETKFSSMEQMMQAIVDRDRMNLKGTWQLKATYATGVFAVIAAIIVYFTK